MKILLISLLFPIVVFAQTDVTMKTAADSDDGGCYTTTFTDTTQVAYIGNYGGHHNFEGYRWDNVPIPKDAVINSCYIAWRAAASRSDDPDMLFYGEDTADCATFSDETDFGNRTNTTASVNVTVWDAWTSGTWYRAGVDPGTDMKTLLQEVVNRADWDSLNAFAILTLDQSSSSNTLLRVSMRDNNAAYGCSLIVNWSPAAAGGDGQFIMINDN